MATSPVSNVLSIVSQSGVVTLWLTREDGTKRQCSVSTDHVNHRRITERLKAKDFSDLEELIDPVVRAENVKERAAETIAAARIPNSLVGTAEIRNGQVYVNNVPVHNLITDRLLQLASEGYSVDPVLRFLELVLMNPSSKSQEELYDFLANRNLPLTEDGHFLAYKRVDDNFYDLFSHTIDNSVGRIVEIDRSKVDPDRTRECSYGLHVGALEYVRIYHGGQGHVVVVKVNPADAVSVPKDYNHQKMRVARYEVLYELETGDQVPLDRPVYSTTGKEYQNPGEWVDEYETEDADTDQYWAQGWDDDYESWSKDRLAMECVRRELLVTRQEGRDLGNEGMIQLLREADEDSDAYGDDDCVSEDCESCDQALCCCECDEEEDDTFLDSYQASPAVATAIVHPKPGDVWAVREITEILRASPAKLGDEVVVRTANASGVTYRPGLSGAKEGFMFLDTFLETMAQVG